jgi:hypothetical protein
MCKEILTVLLSSIRNNTLEELLFSRGEGYQEKKDLALLLQQLLAQPPSLFSTTSIALLKVA